MIADALGVEIEEFREVTSACPATGGSRSPAGVIEPGTCGAM